jgi:hypothetical protein
MHPATIIFLRQIGRLIKGLGSAFDEWANAMDRAYREEKERELKK